MGFMYIVKCADGSYYTGSTRNLEKRLWEHNQGMGADYTKKRLPVELIYVEEYPRIDEAFHREKQIQGWSRRKKEALIERNYEKLREYAKPASTLLSNRASTTLSNPASTGLSNPPPCSLSEVEGR